MSKTEATIRVATAADAARIAQISIDGWRAAYRGLMPDEVLDNLDLQKRTAGWTASIEKGSVQVMLAIVDGQAQGFCSLLPTRDKDKQPTRTAEIPAIYICPTHWRRGLGNRLWSAVRTVALAAGHKEMTLWVLTTNAPARRFYEAIGFQPDGATKIETGIGSIELPHVRYQREL